MCRHDISDSKSDAELWHGISILRSFKSLVVYLYGLYKFFFFFYFLLLLLLLQIAASLHYKGGTCNMLCTKKMYNGQHATSITNSIDKKILRRGLYDSRMYVFSVCFIGPRAAQQRGETGRPQKTRQDLKTEETRLVLALWFWVSLWIKQNT